MNWAQRLDNYAKQNGGENVPLTSRQDRRCIHKDRREAGDLAGVWISGAKNKPTPRRPRRGPS